MIVLSLLEEKGIRISRMNEIKSVCIIVVMSWGMVWELIELEYGLEIEAKV